MQNIKKRFINVARKAHDFLSDVKFSWKKSDDPLQIIPYRSYMSRERLFLEGRVLEDESIFVGKSDNEIRNLLNSFKRFESDEVPGVKVEVHFNGQIIKTQTDQEGYFIIDEKLKNPLPKIKSNWIDIPILLPGLPSTTEDDIHGVGEVLLPHPEASYGIITDIDDTVLQTHVTSLFRLKMIYATLVNNVHDRLPMEGIQEVLQKMIIGEDGARVNPIFYVSNSPWNIYDMLEEFLALHQLPKGPILLRDVGIQFLDGYVYQRKTKQQRISHILEMYPNLPFIMLGDSAHDDADVYLEMAQKYPKQLKTFYIRKTKDTKNARRIVELIEQSSFADGVVVERSVDILEDAWKKGYILKG